MKVLISAAVGGVAAVALWTSGHPVWAVIAFLVIGGGAWTLVPWHLLNPRRRRDAAEFRAAAMDAGIWSTLTATDAQELFSGWLQVRRQHHGMPARTYLAVLFPPTPPQ
ncbi:hypothetical protein ABRQ22_16760 [Cellulosimicrobium sp. ES-005]|uniref:Uncharacterized protein n=1 Tax=Cellulosimicrobium sp. ES-005 TaxID=3163031 RepID=A0AAU8FZH7_9MICO